MSTPCFPGRVNSRIIDLTDFFREHLSGRLVSGRLRSAPKYAYFVQGLVVVNRQIANLPLVSLITTYVFPTNYREAGNILEDIGRILITLGRTLMGVGTNGS